MKKLLSYILTFITMFVISAVVTIKIKSDLLVQTQPTTSAGASGQTSLLGGVMQSLETNPKLDVAGDIKIQTAEIDLGVSINASLDLTTLTNPSIMGSVGLTLNNQTYQLLLTYRQNQIYIACDNVSIKAEVSDLSQLGGIIASVIGQDITLPSIQLPQIDLDSVMAALNNPVKTQVEDTTYYQITLPDIAKVTLACDKDYNIQGISIDELYFLPDTTTNCNLVVNQNENIKVEEPSNNASYLNVAELIQNFISLKDKQLLYINGYTSVYANNRLFERIDTYGYLSFPTNKYQLSNNIKGALNGKLNVDYISDTIYASFNDIGMTATNEDINSITNLLEGVNNEQPGTTTAIQTASLTTQLMDWLANNYNTLLDNAVVSSNQIVLVADFNGILGQTKTIKFVLGLKDGQINSIRIDGLVLDKFTVYTSINIEQERNHEFEVDQNKYYSVGKILEIIDWAQNLNTLNINANINLQNNGNNFPISINSALDLINNTQQIDTSVYGLPINVVIANDISYINMANMYVSVKNQTVGALLAQLMPQQQIDSVVNNITNIIQNLSINDILTLVDISTTHNAINLKADLSQFVGKTFVVDLSLEFNNGLCATLNKIQFDGFVINGSIEVENSTQQVIVKNPEQYLETENFVEYLNSFISSQYLTINGEIDFEQFSGLKQKFIGAIALDFANTDLTIKGKLVGKLNADIELTYKDNVAFVKYNKQRFSISKDKLCVLLQQFNIDISPILNKIDEIVKIKNNLSIEKLLAGVFTGKIVVPSMGTISQETIKASVDFIKTININSYQISMANTIAETDLQITLGLKPNLEVKANANTQDFNVDANLQISTTPIYYSELDDYINLDLIVPRIVATLNTAKYNNFSGTIYAKWGSTADQEISVDYKLHIDIANMQFAVQLSAEYNNLSISISLLNNDIYLKVEDIYVSLTLEQLIGFMQKMFSQEIESFANKFNQIKNISTNDILQLVYDTTTKQPLIKDIYNSGATSYITLSNNVTIAIGGEKYISFVSVKYNNQYYRIKIKATQGDNIVSVENSEQYINIVDLVNYANDFVTASDLTFAGEISLDTKGGANQTFNGLISLDFANTGLLIKGKLVGKLNADIELVYKNNIAYITYNKQYFTISKTDLIAIASEFDLDLEPIFENIDQCVERKNQFDLINYISEMLNRNTQTNANSSLQVSAQQVSTVDFAGIVDTIKSIKVTAKTISANLVIGDLQINTVVGLNEQLDIVASVGYGEYNILLNAQLSTKHQDAHLSNNFVNLGLLSGYKTAIQNTLNATSLSGKLNIAFKQDESDLEIYYQIEHNQQGVDVCLSTTYLDLPINIYFVNNQIYLNVNEIFVNVTLQQLLGFVNALFGDKISELQSQIEQQTNLSLDEILQLVYDTTISDTIVSSLTKTNNILCMELLDSINLQLGAENTLNYIAVDLQDMALSATIDAKTSEQKIQVPQIDNYLNIEDFVNYIETFVTSSNLTVSGLVEFENESMYQNFNGSISLDFANAGLLVKGQLVGKLNADIELVYINDIAYITYNKQSFTINKAELIAVASQFDLDLQSIFDTIDKFLEIKNEFSLKEYLFELLTNSSASENTAQSKTTTANIDIIKLIKSIEANKNNIKLDYVVSDYDLFTNIALDTNMGVVATVLSSNFNIGADLTISTQANSFEISQNYISLNGMANIIDSVKNTIADRQFKGTITFALGSTENEKLSATYNVSLIENKVYGSITLTYLNQTANVYIMADTLYINVKGIYIKATLSQIEELLNTELPQETKQQITDFTDELKQETKKDIFELIYNLTNQTIIESLQIVDNKLDTTIKGANISITTSNNKISQVDVKYKDITATITIESSNNTAIPELETEAYLDIDTVYSLVKNVYNYAVGEQYYFNVNFSAFGYSVTGYVGYDSTLNAQLSTTILDKTLTVTILDSTVYINFDGLNAHITFADILAFVTELNSQFNLDIPQNILDIIDGTLNANSSVDVQKTVEDMVGNDKPTLKELLNDIFVGLTDKMLTINYKQLSAVVNYANNMITDANVTYVIDEANQEKIIASLTLVDKQNLTVNTAGINVANATNLLKDIATIVKNTNYAGKFKLNASDITLTGTYKLIIQDNQLSAHISTEFYNIPIEIIVVNNTIYAKVDNIKIYLPLTQLNNLIEWINSSFETTIKQDIDVSTNLESFTGDISLDELTLGNAIVDILNNIVSISYKDLSAQLTIDQTISAKINYGSDLSVELDISESNSTISVEETEYLHYTELTSIVDSLVDLYNGKTISATANGYVYEGSDIHYTATCAVQIDLANLTFYANVSVLDHFKDETISFMLAYRNNYWFVDYNNLKLKINKTDLAEIMAILLDLVGIDPSLLPFLEGVAGGLNVDVESMKSIVPKLDFGDPLSLIDVFEGLKLQTDSFSAIIDNSLISDKVNVDNMTAELKTSNGKLSYIALNKLYTGITDYEYLNFTLSLTEFTGVSEPTAGTYIDISGSNELIKALINTAELNYFEVQGTINLNINIKAISLNIDWDIPINIKVRLDENRKPEILIALGSIPSVAGVNNDVPYVFGDVESSETRMWYIYYKDDYIYMLREDEIDWFRVLSAGSRIYQKKLKAHVDSVFDDFFYYLQWGVGFTDSIMGAIEDALALSDNYDPDLGKIINSFTCKDDSNFSVDINLQEISNNPQVKNMVVNLGVVNNESTNNKNYLGNAELYLYMPIEKDVFEIDLVSTDLTLINIGKTFDFTAFESFVYNYTGTEGVEYDRTWDIGKSESGWEVAAERVYTITFEEQGGQTVSDISGKPGDKITLPTLSNKIVLDSTAGKRYTYQFGGWYTTELCKNGTEFNDSTMPRSNKVLYAKWVLILTETVVIISFNSNGGTAVESISGFAGNWVDVSTKQPTKATTWVDNGYNWVGKNAGKWTYVYTHYTFAGWYTDSACTKKFDGYIPSSNITLYAKWNTTTETKYHYNWDRP